MPEVIELSSPRGNAFYIIGRVRRRVVAAGGDADEVQTDMTSSDYAHVLKVAMDWGIEFTKDGVPYALDTEEDNG